MISSNRNEYMKNYMKEYRAKKKLLSGDKKDVNKVNVNKNTRSISPEELKFLNKMFRLMIRRRVITTVDEDIFQELLDKFTLI